MTSLNTQVRVRKRAQGVPTADCFTITQAPRPDAPPGGVMARTLLAAVDPAMRGWLSTERNYITVPDGAVMKAHGIGEVIESDHPDYAPGDLVYGWTGWQTWAAMTADEVMWKIDAAAAPPEAWLGPLGINGLTAWVGFRHLAQPKAGETVLVSTAAGGVGGVVGQLARDGGQRAVGLTSTDDKVETCIADYGFDEAISYRRDDLADAIARACPGGIDIFYDNTAGAIADAVFPHLNTHARVIQCGTASIADWTAAPSGPRRERNMLVKRLTWRGFVFTDHAETFPQALDELKGLYARGRLRLREDILDGLESAPGALQRLYSGANTGRLLIRV